MPTRNKFAYSCTIKIHASVFSDLLESIFYLLKIVEAFSLQKSCQDAWSSGIRSARGQVADEAKLHSPICSTFEATCGQTSCRSIRPFLLTNAVCRHCNFLSIFLRCNGFAAIQKAVVDRMNSRSLNSDHDLFSGQVLLWEGLWSFFSVQPLGWLEKEMATHSISLPREYHKQRSLVGYSPWGRKKSDMTEWLNNWAGHHQSSYKIHFSAHLTIRLRNGSLLWCTIWEDDTSKTMIF